MSERKVRYQKVSELITYLIKYKKAIGKMKTSITAIREIYKEGRGKTMESLVKESDVLIKYMGNMEQEIDDLATLLDHYIMDTTAIIKPDYRDRVMKMDRDNISRHKNSIISTSSKISTLSSDVTVACYDDWVMWGADEKERELELERRARNDAKLDSIRLKIREAGLKIPSLIDQVNGVYNNVKNYEDKDRQYAHEAKKLVKDQPNFMEKDCDVKEKLGRQVFSAGEGFVDSLRDMLTGLADLTAGIGKYDASFLICLYGEATGNDIPKWAEECYYEGSERANTVLRDPILIVDGIKNGIQETYEEKGAAYCGGYAAGLLAGPKIVGKVAKTARAARAAGTLREMGYVEESVTAADVAVDVAEDLSKGIKEVEYVAEAGEELKNVSGLANKGKSVAKGAKSAENIVGKAGGTTKLYNLVEYKGSVKVNGEVRDVSRRVYQRNDIDIYYFDETTGLTNLERMQAGKPPIGSDGNPIQLHHILQKEAGPMVEIREITHQEYYSQLHGFIEDGASFRNNPVLNKQYNNFRRSYWKWRAEQVIGGQ